MKSFSLGRALVPAVCVVLAIVVGTLYARSNQQQQAVAAILKHQEGMQQLYLADREMIQDRVIDLPEDGQAYYLTVFTSEQQTPKERALLSWFQSDATLASLKAQTHWNHYTPAVKMYQTRFASAVPSNQFPAVMLQGPDCSNQQQHGKVYFKCSAGQLPDSPQKLVAMIRDALKRPCPPPGPGPTPTPPPVNPQPIPLIPDVGPSVTPPSSPVEDQSLMLAVGAFVVCLGLGIANEWRKTHPG